MVGDGIADHLRTSLVTDALAVALATRALSNGVISHSNRGYEYTSKEFAHLCMPKACTVPWAAAQPASTTSVAELFFASYKKELIRTRPWNDLTEVRQHAFLWIEGHYNRRSRHSTLNYLTPHEYDPGYRKLTNLTF